MKRTALQASAALSLLVCLPWSFAQTVASPPEPTTIKTGITNVLVDVVVTDQHSNPVDDLPADSFTVLENGHPQRIVSVEHHPPKLPSDSPATTNAAIPMSAGVYTNEPSLPDSDTSDVLLIDGLNTPVESQIQSHLLLVQYLKTLPINKPIAIFTLDGPLRQVEDFTTDHSRLLKAVEDATRAPQRSTLLKTQQDTSEQMSHEDDIVELGVMMHNPGVTANMLHNFQQFSANKDSFNIDLRVKFTLNAFAQLARYLSGIPGRKNVIWLSGSFPLSILPDSDLKNPFEASRDYSSDVAHVSRLLTEARAALYPIDARGLFPSAIFGPSVGGGRDTRSLDSTVKAENAHFSQNAEEQLSLEKFAHETGGEAIYNTNDLKGALAKVDHIGSHYYTLAYIPSDKSENRKLRRIQVRVNPGRGYTLAYRRSYIPGEEPHSEKAGEEFRTTMQHNVPASTQILFRLAPAAISPQPDTLKLIGDNPNVRRPVTRCSIDYGVNVSRVQLTPAADGTLQGTATLLTIAYDNQGHALNSATNTLNIHLAAADYQKFLTAGIHFRQQLDLPTQTQWLRAGVLDGTSGLIGSLEIPFSTKPTTY